LLGLTGPEKGGEDESFTGFPPTRIDELDGKIGGRFQRLRPSGLVENESSLELGGVPANGCDTNAGRKEMRRET
jgi:hypothetical protein